MNSNYIEYHFEVLPLELGNEILIAQLGEVGFESFVENETGLKAYIQKSNWNPKLLNDIQILKVDEFRISYSFKEIEQENWNSKWEENFHPIQVDDLVSIRAPFHKKPNLEFDIVIEPKMSFGTGHHETTYLMIQQLLALELKDKKVLDMGCGTGILAIFAEMKGAKPVDAIDIDYWCYENTVENVSRNQCNHIQIFQGDASLLKSQRYDVIIANINRNILVADLKTYTSCLAEGGVLLMSGFYKEDIELINAEAKKYDLKLDRTMVRNSWVSLKYIK